MISVKGKIRNERRKKNTKPRSQKYKMTKRMKKKCPKSKTEKLLVAHVVVG